MLPISGADPFFYLLSVRSAFSVSALARLCCFSTGRSFAPAWAAFSTRLLLLSAGRTLEATPPNY